MIKVMVADDNVELTSTCSNFLAKDENIKVVSRTLDGQTTLRKYKENKPDVLVLDLDLPKLKGEEIINNLCLDSEDKKRKNIIIISGNTLLGHKLVQEEKVYTFIPKPFEYSEILKAIKEIQIEELDFPQEKLDFLLKQLKINLNSNGADYLLEAIHIAYDDSSILHNLQNLYFRIGFTYGVSALTVKWGLRNLVDKVNYDINLATKYSIFNVNDKNFKITPKFFLKTIIDYIS